MPIPCTRQEREQAKFKEDHNGETSVRVCDDKTHDLLSNIGGTSDTTVVILNETIAAADTEQSAALPANTKEFLIRTRGKGELKLAYTSGDSGTLFTTVPSRATKVVTHFFASQTLYFQSPTAGEIVEIVAYT